MVETQSIPSLCIHVERGINKIKNLHIWDSIVPFTMFGVVNQMWSVCAMLYNFQNSIISEKLLNPCTPESNLVSRAKPWFYNCQSFNADGDSPVMEVTKLSVPNPWYLTQNNFKIFAFLSWSITFWNCTDEGYPLHIPPMQDPKNFLLSFTAGTTLYLQ